MALPVGPMINHEIAIAQPAAADTVTASIERRVIRHELARRGVAAPVRFVGDEADSTGEVDVAAGELFGDRHPPLAVLFWRTLDRRAIDVRARMLGHLGLLGEPLGADDETTIVPTDRWILVNAASPDGLPDDLPDELAALRIDDPRRSPASRMLDAAFDTIAGRLGGRVPPTDQSSAPPEVGPLDGPDRFVATVETTASPAPAVDVTPTDRPDVSFVIVTYGTGSIVVDAIAALCETADRPFEVVVVDNENRTRPGRSRRHLLLATRGVRLVTPGRNLGFGGGCELGVLHARARTLGLINPDLEVGPDWLRPLVQALDDPSVAIAAPVLLDPDGCVQEAGQRLRRDLWTRPETRPERADTADFASAACWLVSRRWHERVGGFDAAFHPAYFEDADYVLRARELGGRLRIVPDVQVVHHRGGSTDASADPIAQHAEFSARWASALNR